MLLLMSSSNPFGVRGFYLYVTLGQDLPFLLQYPAPLMSFFLWFLHLCMS